MKKKKLLTNLVIDSSHHSAHGINTDRCDGGLLLRNLDIKKQQHFFKARKTNIFNHFTVSKAKLYECMFIIIVNH